jgi:hypothetical protein
VTCRFSAAPTAPKHTQRGQNERAGGLAQKETRRLVWRGGTGVAVWKSPAVDDSAMQLSTTASFI